MPITYRLFYVIGDADSVKAKRELWDALIPLSLHPVDREDHARLAEDFGISSFPALVSGRASFSGLAAIRYFIERKKKGRANPK